MQNFADTQNSRELSTEEIQNTAGGTTCYPYDDGRSIGCNHFPDDAFTPDTVTGIGGTVSRNGTTLSFDGTNFGFIVGGLVPGGGSSGTVDVRFIADTHVTSPNTGNVSSFGANSTVTLADFNFDGIADVLQN